jgi:hypothetical protein
VFVVLLTCSSCTPSPLYRLCNVELSSSLKASGSGRDDTCSSLFLASPSAVPPSSLLSPSRLRTVASYSRLLHPSTSLSVRRRSNVPLLPPSLSSHSHSRSHRPSLPSSVLPSTHTLPRYPLQPLLQRQPRLRALFVVEEKHRLSLSDRLAEHGQGQEQKIGNERGWLQLRMVKRENNKRG